MFSNNSKDNPQGVDVFKVYFKPIPDKANAWKCLCNHELQQNIMNYSAYQNLSWIPATSNIVERLFSKAKLVYSDKRTRLLPKNLEIILYLTCNKDLWDEDTVNDLMTSRPDVPETPVTVEDIFAIEDDEPFYN
jgi:hypothetical protein